MSDCKTCCKCPCHKALGFFVLLLGLVFLLGTLNVLSPRIVNHVWPIVVMLIGAKLAAKGCCKCCDAA